jgi:hypothetical protein
MMLRFREDKIQRMESLLRDSIPADAYLLEENRALSEEIQLLQAKVDRNPEVTRFALENIRLLDQLRRYYTCNYYYYHCYCYDCCCCCFFYFILFFFLILLLLLF